MIKKEIKFNIYIPDLSKLKSAWMAVGDWLEQIKYHKIWCKYRPHLWKEYRDAEHWRKCRRCGERELNHDDWLGSEDWHPTNYGTPEWDKI